MAIAFDASADALPPDRLSGTTRFSGFIGSQTATDLRKAEVIMRQIVLMIVLLTASVAPALAQRAEIDAANAKWIELFNKGDFDGVAQLYTANAIALPPGSPMVKGRAALSKMWKGMSGQASNPKLTTLEVKRLGPNAIREIGTYSLMTKEPTPKEVAGKYLVVWEKVRGEWKLAADIWNDGK